METKKISSTTIALLAGLILTGCHKDIPQQKTSSSGKIVMQTQAPAAGITISGSGSQTESNFVSRDLGAVTLTNHFETCVPLGAGKDCLVTPKMLDGHNVQLTFAVETKNAKGKVHDLSITQVVTRTGKPFEVAVGEFNFSLTPNVTSE